MAQQNEDFDFDDDGLSDGDLVKRLRKVISDQKKLINEQSEELDGFYTSTWESDIQGALTEMGVDPRLARFVPDGVESVDQLEDWVQENAEVFGIVPAEDGGLYANDINREHIEAAEMMAAVEEGDVDPQIGMDLHNRIESAGSKEELLSLLKG